MTAKNIRFEKLNGTLPSTLTPNTLYFVKSAITGTVTNYLSDQTGTAAEQLAGKTPSYNDITDKPFIPTTGADIGLENVDNTSDLDKPISTATQTALDDKVNNSDLITDLTLKADKTELTSGLALKADSATVTADLALKADKTELTNGLALKADSSALTSGLALKADKTELTTGLALKADSATVTADLALKADSATLTSGLALKADKTELTTGLALKLDNSKVGTASGACDLDTNQKVPLSRLPDSILGSLSYQGVRDMTTALPAADATNKGWYYIASNASPVNGFTKGDWAVSNGVTWDRIDNTSAVQSVAGRTGVITLSTTDLSDFATAVSTPLGLKAPLASPTFTGTVTIPTPASNDNSTTAASTAFVNTVVSTKAPLASPALTGIPTAPTAANGTNTTQIATTAFVLANALSAASPALTGTPTAPTAAAGTKTTQLATTEFVATSFAPIASPTFTGTVSGITATMVGLPNVDNTKDTDKPVSTAQKAALDAKAPLTIPLTTKSTAYTLVATDKSCKINTTANITINKDVFSAGDSVIICNTNTTATAITISIGTGLTCYLDGNVTAKTSLVLTARGTAAFMFDSGTVANAVGKSLS